MPKPAELKELQRWILDPLYWAQKFLSTPDKPYVPSKQQRAGWEAYRRILVAKYKRAKGAPMTDQEKSDARKIGVSIMSGHGTGKDAFSAAVGLHFQMTQIEPKVIVTAPAGPQLFTVIWPEFGKWINRSPYLKDLFEKDANKVYLKERGGSEQFIKPRTIQPNASPDEQGEVLAGTHAYSVMFICDEASDIPQATFKPIEGGMTDPVSIVIMIFNPTKRSGFAIESHTKNREDWLCLHWDAEELREEKLANPSAFFWFDEQAQERLAKKYGRDSDFYRVRVRGLPPNAASDILIPFEWVMQAVDRDYDILPADPLTIGVDVGGEGEDKTIVMPRRGPKVVGIHEFHGLDTTNVAWRVEACLREHLMADDVQHAVGIDIIGIGRGVYDYLHHEARVKNLYPVNVSEKPSDDTRFWRLRDEIWWMARDAFQGDPSQGLIPPSIPNDDELIGELTSIKWKEERGRIKVESKLDMKKRGLSSPNKADAFIMTELLLRRFVSRMPESRQRLRRRRADVSNWKLV